MKTPNQSLISNLHVGACHWARLAGALALIICALATFAQVPQLIHYQGRIAVNGVNFDGNGQFKFALIGTNSSGANVTYWSNNGSSAAGAEPSVAVVLPVSKGLYSVLLGDLSVANMTPLPASVFAASNLWLRVWFNDGTRGSQRIIPDQRIAAVGYAMMAAAVSDGIITAAKIAPGAVVGALADNSLPIAKLIGSGNAGQILATDPNGALRWEEPDTLASYRNAPSLIAPNAAENSVDIEIPGLISNRVIVVSGPGFELEEMRQWTPEFSVFGLSPRTANMLPFVFEYAGSAAGRLLAELNSVRTNAGVLNRTINLLIRDAAGIVRVRWTLPRMELTRIDPGSEGRLRYTFACGNNPWPDILYTRNPTNFPSQVSLPAGTRFLEIEIDGILQGGYPEIEVDSREQTLTLTFEYAEAGSALAWLIDTLQFARQDSMINRSLSLIRKELIGTQRVEYSRINYYDVYPIRFQQIGGFSNRDKLKERVVLRYRIRERA